jgi:predicted unusual protein kinase regulating ubiquinone biosynthesis (AarF/ABC1/UbiB family)
MSIEKERWAKLAGLPESTDKQQLDENFVGMGMVGNIFDHEKTDYELAFEHFTKDKMVTENIGTTLDKLLNTFEFSQKGNDEMIELANYILSPEGPKNIAMFIKNKLKGEGGEKYFTSNPEALNTLLSKLNINENFVGMGMVGNIFDREKEKYEDAFEHFLSEMYEKEGKVEEELATPSTQQSDLNSLKFNIFRAIPSFKNKEELKKYLLGLVGELEDNLFNKEK